MAENIKYVRVTTPTFRINYPKVFKPESFDGSEEKYSIVMMFDKKADLSKVKEAIKKAAIAEWGDKIPKGLKVPVRDGDKEREGKEGFEGTFFANASSKNKPKVVDKAVQPIIDPEEIYSGCYCVASITAKAYEYMGKKGITFYLNGIQKVKDGDRLGFDSSNDFEVIEEAESKPAELDFDSSFGSDDDIAF